MTVIKAVSVEYATAAGTVSVLSGDMFTNAMASLIFTSNLNDKLLASFRENYLWKFDDIRFFMLKAIK